MLEKEANELRQANEVLRKALGLILPHKVGFVRGSR